MLTAALWAGMRSNTAEQEKEGDVFLKFVTWICWTVRVGSFYLFFLFVCLFVSIRELVLALVLVLGVGKQKPGLQIKN